MPDATIRFRAAAGSPRLTSGVLAWHQDVRPDRHHFGCGSPQEASGSTRINRARSSSDPERRRSRSASRKPSSREPRDVPSPLPARLRAGPRHAHALHRFANLRIRQRRLMPGPDAGPGKRCADGVSGRVVLPIALRDRPAHHGQDALPHPAGSLPLSAQMGRRTAIASAVAVRLTGHFSASPHCVVAEARPPSLLLPAAVRPTRHLDGDHRVDGHPEGRNHSLPAGQGQIAPAPGHRVHDAFPVGLSQADMRPGSESKVAGSSVHDDALRPGLGQVAAGGTADQQRRSFGAASASWRPGSSTVENGRTERRYVSTGRRITATHLRRNGSGGASPNTDSRRRRSRRRHRRVGTETVLGSDNRAARWRGTARNSDTNGAPDDWQEGRQRDASRGRVRSGSDSSARISTTRPTSR